MIHKAKEERNLKGVMISSTVKLTHVLFVDDVLLLGEGSYVNFQNLANILETYQKATRMAVNIEKTKLTFNNIPDEFLSRTKELLPFPTASIAKGFKYLGFILKPNPYSFQDWIWIYNKVEACCNLTDHRRLPIIHMESYRHNRHKRQEHRKENNILYYNMRVHTYIELNRVLMWLNNLIYMITNRYI